MGVRIPAITTCSAHTSPLTRYTVISQDISLPGRSFTMDLHWQIEEVTIQHSFLDGLTLQFPPGLTCIIGPRGSGKSTLAEALRFAIAGPDPSSKERDQLFKANLLGAAVGIRAKNLDDGRAFLVRREAKRLPIIQNADGTVLTGVELDRGTFLPLDAYSFPEIDQIAQETSGPKRRTLLDQLREVEFRELAASTSSAERALAENADQAKLVEHAIASLRERIAAASDARPLLSSMPHPETSPLLDAIQQAEEVVRRNAREDQFTSNTAAWIASMEAQLKAVRQTIKESMPSFDDPKSRNQERIAEVLQASQNLTAVLDASIGTVSQAIADTSLLVASTEQVLARNHAEDDVRLADLRAQDRLASDAIKAYADAVEAVRRLDALESELNSKIGDRDVLQIRRKDLRLQLVEARDRISSLRRETADELTEYAGENVRVKVTQNGDSAGYRQLLANGLSGAGVKPHEEIVNLIATNLRPEEIADILHRNVSEELDRLCRFGPDRSRKIVDAMRRNLSIPELEVILLDDRIDIELNVGLTGDENYKDAANLSRGQKCTALLPLLLARRSTPLVIDQPEDNLDNHFIYQTIVESIKRQRERRQMIFITHNANIPVLGHADLVVVLGSDGERGFVQKQGSVNECRREIIDLLEGGRKAFSMRRAEYGID